MPNRQRAADGASLFAPVAGAGGGYRMDRDQVSTPSLPGPRGPYNEYYSSLNGPAGQDAPGSMEARDEGRRSAEAYQPVFDAYGAGYAATVADINARRSGLENQLGMLGAYGQMTEQNLRAGHGLDLEELGIRGEGIGLDRRRNDLRMEGYGIDRLENESDREYTRRVRGLGREGYEARRQRLVFESGETARGLKDDAGVRGALFAPGYTDDQTANFLRTWQDLDDERRRWEEAEAGFDRDERGFGFRDRRIGLSEREVGLANEGLDQASRALGVDRRRLELGLSQGLAQLGLDQATSVEEIMAGIRSGETARQQASLQLLDQLLAVLPPDLFSAGQVYEIVYGPSGPPTAPPATAVPGNPRFG